LLKKEIDTLGESVTGLQMELQQQRDENERTSEVLNSLASVFGAQGRAPATARAATGTGIAAAGKAGKSTATEGDEDLDAAIDKALDFL